MIDFLERQQWDYFATLTFAPHVDGGAPPTRKMCRRAVERWAKNCTYIDRIYWCTEAGDRNGRLHVHALVAVKPRDMWTARMLEDFVPLMRVNWKAGRTLIERIDPAKGAAHYSTKSTYTTKGNLDWDLWLRPGT